MDRLSDAPTSYYIDAAGKLAEADNKQTSKVAEDGIYRITIDFTNKGASITGIEKMGVFFCPSNAVIIDMDYVGLGVWSGSGVLHLKPESWGVDERYKFQLETTSGTEQFGTKIDSDSPPNADSPASYYYITLLDQVSQWDHKWKFDHSFDGKNINVTLSLQGGVPYTHSVKGN